MVPLLAVEYRYNFREFPGESETGIVGIAPAQSSFVIAMERPSTVLGPLLFSTKYKP